MRIVESQNVIPSYAIFRINEHVKLIKSIRNINVRIHMNGENDTYKVYNMFAEDANLIELPIT